MSFCQSMAALRANPANVGRDAITAHTERDSYRQHWSRRNWMTAVIGGAGSLLAGSTLSAAPRAPQRPGSESGVSSRDARDDASRQIPLAKLSREDRNRVASVLNDTSIFRRLPTQIIPCDAQMFQFLAVHPDMIVGLWRVLGISEVSLDRTGPNTFRTDDKQGTRGTLEILHSSQDNLLAIADGSYDGALFTRRVVGKCVLSLRSQYHQDAERTPLVTCKLDAFIQIDNIGAELLAKSFQPLVGHFADHNFRETAYFVSMLNRAAEVNPGKVEQLTAKVNDVSPVTRQQFVTLTHQLAARVAVRDETVDVEPPRLAKRPVSNDPIRR